ncbi:zinc finger FYVE domain-containing protein 1-like isoform X2 [Ptychodera flava]|uniref:zinc finger FYVE domain-containing protein 1-like isoform X2 n=1 Tax=Ptychodera flava TaxID=63121 RepID=UPI00396A8181
MSMSTLAFQNFQETGRMALRKSRVAMVTPQSQQANFDRDEGDSKQPSSVDVPFLDTELKQVQLEDDEDLYSATSNPSAASSAVLTDDDSQAKIKGFLLVDDKETLKPTSEDEFIEELGCPDDATVKVVSIFGNTGDGKSYTLNHTFYDGKEVFQTSPNQDSCTIGVWAAYDNGLNVITIDTEGLLGTTPNQNQRTRLLLKVLAVSDIVIYRTGAERLHNDLCRFLGDASKAYEKHFTKVLKAAAERWDVEQEVSLSNLGPAVIVFHETSRTNPLGYNSKTKSAETLLKERFMSEGKDINAFSSLRYVGIKNEGGKTDFTSLKKVIRDGVMDSTVRSPRSPYIIYKALWELNTKFSDKIEDIVPNVFPDEYFTCNSKCLSCQARCILTMNHLKERVGHSSETRCKYQHQYDNNVYTCRNCYEDGRETLVVPKTSASSESTWLGLAKYAWSGYVIECPHCGIIYRSRQHWYGNKEPVEGAVRTEIRHVWPGGNPVLQGTHNAARRLLDGLSHVAGTVGSVGAKPTKMLSDWMTDQIAPAYWIPNNQIKECSNPDCAKNFEEMGLTKHHCRGCGKGFCNDCTTKRRAVPERGWGQALVRVCDACYKTADATESKESREGSDEVDANQVTARKVGEVIGSTLSVVASAIEYPKGLVVDAARPAYWVPDNEIQNCCCCKQEFGSKLTIHHCRACGDGVCKDCSPNSKPVPSRGWDHPVRICKNCEALADL